MSTKKNLKNILIKNGFARVHPLFHNGDFNFSIGDFHYDLVLPVANYSPWKGDSEFINIYAQIKEFTLVDIYRCYELWQLSESMFNLQRDAAFLEIGVWRGGTGAILAKKLKSLNGNTRLYLADTFEGVVKASEKDTFYNGGEHRDTSEDSVKKLISDTVQYSNCKILKGIFPEETEKFIPKDEVFSLCHIDVDVYDSGKDIIEWIWNKLIIGGTLIFDDYGFHYTQGITRLVEEQRKHNDRIVIHNLNGHAVVIKVK